MLKHETAKAEPAEEVEGKLILIDLAGFEDNRLATLSWLLSPAANELRLQELRYEREASTLSASSSFPEDP